MHRVALRVARVAPAPRPPREPCYIAGVLRVATLAVIGVIGCSGDKPAPARVPLVARDAGVVAPEPEDEVAPDPATELPVRAPARPAARAARPIDVTLRSSPSGATVAVDGVPVGVTPTYWAGDANGREHEFLFVRKGYAYARYRFVPVTSGVVHARLDPIADDRASLPPELLAPPAPAPAPRPAAPAPDRDPTTGPGPQP